MCGIAAAIDLGGGSPSNETVQRMVAVMAHRGPDQCHIEAFPGAIFGHGRLAIIDLSRAADQPLAVADGRYSIVLNGEIYNYLELRRELEQHGHTFRTSGDAEVAAVAFVQWGARCLDRFNGMFALAIYDSIERRCFVARDRFGVKPLYYATRDGLLLIASEMKGLLAAGVPVEPDYSVIADFFAGRGTDAGARTPFRNVLALPAGHYLTTSGASFSIQKWYDVHRSTIDLPGSFDERVEAFRGLLDDAVALRLRADVPTAVSLSGGIDSAAIYALTRGQPAGAHTRAVAAVSPGDPIDESVFIDATVEHFGDAATRVALPPALLPELLDDVVWHQESLVWEAAVVAFHALYRQVANLGVRVILEGHGADEMLAGYPYLIAAGVKTGLRTLNPTLVRDSIHSHALATNTALGDRKHSVARLLLRQILSDSVVSRARRVLSHAPSPHGSLGGNEYLGELLQSSRTRTEHRPHGGNALQSNLDDAFLSRILPGVLRVFDRAAMASSVESRMPFLDYRVVEFAFALPATDIIGAGENKHILRAAMRGVLPRNVVDQRAKIGFSAPTPAWLQDARVRAWLDDVVHDSRFSNHGLIDRAKFVAAYDRAAATGQFGWHESVRLWEVLNLDRWWHLFVERDWGAPLPSRHGLQGVSA